MKATRVLAVAAALCGLVACADAARPAAATVNGHQILVSRVTDALERFETTQQFDQLAEQSDPGTARRQFEQAYLGQQIRRLVLRPRAEALGIEVTDSEISSRLDQIKQGFPSEEEFQKALEDRGFTQAELSGLVRDQLIEEELRAKVTADARPDESDLRRYYEGHRDEYRQTEVQHILVEKMPLARRLSERLRAAPKRRLDALFARLAREHSTDKSNARKGGELGWVSPGQLVEPFETAMNELGPGEVSAPVPTDFGVHVIRVTGRRLQPFQRVRPQIAQQLGGAAAEEAWRQWVEEAYGRADVELNPRYGELDPVTGQIINAGASDVPGASEDSPTPGG